MNHNGIEVGEDFLRNCPFPVDHIAPVKRKENKIFKARDNGNTVYLKTLLSVWLPDMRQRYEQTQVVLSGDCADSLNWLYQTLIRNRVFPPGTKAEVYSSGGYHDIFFEMPEVAIYRGLGFSKPFDRKKDEVISLLNRHGIHGLISNEDISMPRNYGSYKGKPYLVDVEVISWAFLPQAHSLIR